MNTKLNTWGLATGVTWLLLVAMGSGCGGNSSNNPDPAVGTLEISHSLDPVVAPEEGSPSLKITVSGLDNSDSVIFGPLELRYADEHTIANVPTAVERLQIVYRHGTGQQVALAELPVEVRANQPTRVLAEAAGAPNQVIVELVNDSDNPGGDETLFILFDTPKDSGTVAGIELLENSGSASASATGVALSTVWPAGKSGQPELVSHYTGKTRPIYSFTLSDVDSGRLTFSYETPAAIVDGNAPTATENYRYDKLELTYLGENRSGGGNLTAIDFFAIPLQVDIIHWGETTPDPLQSKSIYASTPTILSTLKALAPDTMGPAFRNTSDEEFHFTAGESLDLSTFARVLSPNTIAAASATGSAAPYPGFGGAKGYLQTLVGKSYQLNGAQYGGYKYKATFASDGQGGYTVHCVGETTAVPAAPLPANADVTLNLPADQLDFFIYATVANMASYSVAGFPFVDDSVLTAEDKVKLANASPYGAMVGDIQAALNFGYLGGRFDASVADPTATQDIDAYYSSVLLPYAYPYVGARINNDGFYNPYAALFYYLSDAYGHPYSDRLAAASPLYSLRAGDTVRITILNDNRLDTPLVSVSSADTTTLDLSWPTVPNATGYTVELSPDPSQANGPFDQQSGPSQSRTISGLTPGTAYLVSVAATGTANDQAIRSAVLPVQGVTAAAPEIAPADITAGDDLPTFKLNLGLTPNFSGMSYVVNGQSVGFDDDASVEAAIGTNTLNLSILDANQTVVYRGTYFITLNADGESADHFDVGSPFALEYNLTPLTQAGPPGTPPYPLGPNYPLTIGTPFTPKPYYQYFEVLFP